MPGKRFSLHLPKRASTLNLSLWRSLPPHFKLSEAHEWAQLVAHDYERTLMDTFEQLDARDNVDGKPSFEFVYPLTPNMLIPLSLYAQPGPSELE